MKLLSVNLNDNVYNIAYGEEKPNQNTFSIVIGKNGTGKSRLLAKVATIFLSVKKYHQNHSKVKHHKADELTFISQDRQVTVKSAIGKGGKIFERNRRTKDNMCKKLIAASISPFDKFPLPKNNKKKIFNQNFYSYIGFKTDKSSLSEKNLLTRFASSIVSSKSNVAVRRTLRLLGYKSDITIEFEHNSERYFQQNNLRYNSRTFRELVLNNQDLYSRVLADDNHLMSYYILQELSQNPHSQIGMKTLSDLIGDSALPRSYSSNSTLDEKTTESLINSLELNISSVKSITLRKNNSNQRLTLNDASSGERSLLLLICSIASQITNDSLILIDEPEISLHPEWQETFIDLLHNAFSHYKRCHFIIATHSPLIISNLPESSCYILNMDENTLFESKNYFNRSADFQLARLFNTPGYQNEYLNRLCVSILSTFAKGDEINNETKENINFLISIENNLEDGDSVKSLIEIIRSTLEITKRC
ncbi:AAA family ATPase [Aliivibrio fischeri]|uniref:AAA family ATPase n=1 Tax=Aliivibrio fischeri TaxID=668 RepID=UPI0012DA26F1|nr:ATP-binding protein [Aliivibrio fischeri]MUK67335.1 AAA family ATPase [Aliivibrio fischeri]